MNVRVLAAVCVWLGACQYFSGLDALDVDAGGSASGAGASAIIEAGVATCLALSAGAVCDPIANCGCGPGWHCQDRGTGATCYVEGARTLGQSCLSDDECAAGTSCMDGLCKQRCLSDEACARGVCRPSAHVGSALPGALACLTRCDFASDGCRDGAHCAELHETSPVPFAVNGDFCIAPLTECPNDLRCDEPEWGTRLCAVGSDASDCRCEARVPGNTCDLVSQCGCSRGRHCALGMVDVGRASLRCIADRLAPKQAGELCDSEAECATGHSCWRGLCEKYCSSDADCASGTCLDVTNPERVSGLRVCTIACSFDSEKECAPGSRCVHAPEGRDYCFIPRAPCPFVADGTCDEARGGSRICADGSDVADCS